MGLENSEIIFPSLIKERFQHIMVYSKICQLGIVFSFLIEYLCSNLDWRYKCLKSLIIFANKREYFSFFSTTK